MASAVVFKGDILPAARDEIIAFSNFHIRNVDFAHSVGARTRLKEVEVYRRQRDKKMQARVVYELTVERDMLNRANTMHGGCTSFLVDVCSSIALALLGMVQSTPADFVSQAMMTTFHAPAPLGATLNIVCTTTSFGSRTVSARAEIWDVTHSRLCMSGVHNKMAPKNPSPIPEVAKL
ncbi:hypothetical protein BD413DRAFT_476692 [Trametes elegans]|nr:hypothetical protein BD413DRAFT_476692 [Trametes elegans]